MYNYIIRDCTYNDLDHVISLQQMWRSEDITHGFVPSNKINLQQKLGKYFNVVELNNDIIGYANGTVHISQNMTIFNDGESYIEVDEIYLIERYSNSGLGSLLLDKLLDSAKQNEVERSLIYSSTKDIDSIINFYKKRDYKTWYVQMYK